MLIEPHLPSSMNDSIFDLIGDYENDGEDMDSSNGTSDSIDIFGRIYDEGTH